MTFTARCPNCNALFRVGEEQLRAHGGLVRCGDCRHVFDARPRLGEIADEDPGAPAVPPQPQTAAREPPALPPEPPPMLAEKDTPAKAPETGPAFEVAPGGEEPDFLRTDKRRAGRAANAAFAVLGVLLAFAFLAQMAVQFRADLLAAAPALRPALETLCAPLSCQVALPMRPDLLAIVSSDLQAIPNTGAMEFDAVIRNRASFPMALPSIELTLTDAQDRPIARKVFSPQDYGPTSESLVPPDSLPPGADRSVRILFMPPGAGVTGFVAYPFFP